MSDNWCASVLAVFERCDDYDSLFWRVEGDEVEFSAICNDLFWWATADVKRSNAKTSTCSAPAPTIS